LFRSERAASFFLTSAFVGHPTQAEQDHTRLRSPMQAFSHPAPVASKANSFIGDYDRRP
jgi:hypothetical protein